MIDTAVANWLELQPGSDEELIANFLRGPAEHRFRHLCGLRDTILAVADQTAEPVVAATKLAWWRDEISRLGTGEARHPLTVGLHRLLPEPAVSAAWLHDLLIAADSLRTRGTPESWRDLCRLCYRKESVPLIVGALAENTDGQRRGDLVKAAEHAGIAWGIAKAAAALSAGAGRQLLPSDIAHDFGLAGLPAAEWRSNAKLQQAIRQMARLAREELQHPEAADPATALVAAVSRSHLRRRERRPMRGAHPLQLLWCAWRAAGGHARLVRPPHSQEPP